VTIKILHDRGKQFLEIARTDHWHANIVLQLAESAGDSIDSLPAYIDRLLAICGDEVEALSRCGGRSICTLLGCEAA
jgi:hypothetical protein